MFDFFTYRARLRLVPSRLAISGSICAALLTLFMILPVDSGEDWAQRALKRAQTPPIGLPDLDVPADNPLSSAKIRLGAKLFHDPRLGRDSSISCASCHAPDQAFTRNDQPVSIGFKGQALNRNAPTILNVGYMAPLLHDGGAASLEVQIWDPLLASDEMANPSKKYVVDKIKALAEYHELFDKAFGTRAGTSAASAINARNIGRALASYQRSLLSANSAFDRWRLNGEEDAMSASAKSGFSIFQGKGRCAQCHLVEGGYAVFTDHAFHNTGIGTQALKAGGKPDFGRMEVTKDPDDRYLIKTPGLRNVALTAPYMHDGSIKTLDGVIRFYNRGGIPNPGLHPLLKPLGLDSTEIADLVAFLNSLTGSNIDELVSEAGKMAPKK